MRRYACFLIFFLIGCNQLGFKPIDQDSSLNKDSAQEVAPLPNLDYTEMVLAGYQGWFSTPGDGAANKWEHWSRGNNPRPGAITFELYPDVSEYPASALIETELGHLGNGKKSFLFTSKNDSVVDTHFRWMKEYGIDGIAAQRFAVGLPSSGPGPVLQFIKKSSIKHGRFFHITYDFSGANASTLIDNIKNDWEQNIEGTLGALKIPNYARASGKPVVLLWGIDHSHLNQNLALEIIRYFKGRGLYVAGGVSHNWRDNTNWHNVYQELDMIQPWTVGGYSSDADIEDNYNRLWIPDRQLADSWGKDYQKVIWPGFAWSNWNGPGQNAFPRKAGHFMWYQARLAIKVSTGLMIAMFDEYDEGTAIAKAAETANERPANQYFLSLDADGISLSSDFYLRLSGAITKLSRKQIADSVSVPVPYR